MPITCPKCSRLATEGALFCDNCGYDLRNAASLQRGVQRTMLAHPTGGELSCPACGHLNLAGSMYCEECGVPLGQPAQPPAPPPRPQYQPPARPPQYPQPPEAVTGRLVIQDTHASLPIPQGKQSIVIGREDPVSGIFPDINLDPYGGYEAGVGRKHAQLSVQGGQVLVEDLNSVNGTFLNRQKLSPGKRAPVHHGDELRLGKLALIYSSN